MAHFQIGALLVFLSAALKLLKAFVQDLDSIALLRSHLDRCDRIFRDLGFDGIYPRIFETAPIEDPVVLQTSLFAMQYATAQCWIDSGASIVAAVGHSFGELVALCVCGQVALEDMARIIAQRAACVRDSWGSERGAMMAVQGNLDKVHEAILLASEIVQNNSTHLGEPISIACYNGPTSFTTSGSELAAEALAHAAPELGLRTKRLLITHAFHLQSFLALKYMVHETPSSSFYSSPFTKRA